MTGRPLQLLTGGGAGREDHPKMRSSSTFEPKRQAARFVGSDSGSPIPRYFLYGEEGSTEQWLVNVESLALRCQMQGWKIEPHTHPRFAQMIFVRSGRGVMSIEGQSFPFSAPVALIVPCHSVHAFDYEIDTDGWVLTLADHYLRELGARAPEIEEIWRSPRPIAFSKEQQEVADIRQALLRLDSELDRGGPGCLLAAEACLLNVIVSLLRQSQAAQAPVASGAGGHAGLVTRFRDLVERRYREGLSVTDFAAELNVTVSRLRTACLAVTGETPIKLLHDRIMAEAKRNLLYSDMSVAQIAYWLGFEDTSYFSRFFHRLGGEPPAKFRAKKG
jgi:AraC family transcriptional activator of pobA